MRPPRDRRQARLKGKGGFVTAPALLLLAMLATLAGVASVYLSSSAASLALYDDRARSQALILAGVELVAYNYLSSAPADRTRKGAITFRLDGALVSVDFISESARIDLNFATRDTIVNLFRVLGASSDEASGYADRIVGWRTAPKQQSWTSETELYRSAGLSYGPKADAFASVEELWLIPGLPPVLVDQTLKFVTVYSGRREVNVFEAAPEVIAALPGAASAQVSAFLAQRSTLPRRPEAAIRFLGTGEGTVAVFSGDNIRLNCSILFDNGRRMSAEVIVQIEGGDEPYEVLSWHEVDVSVAYAEPE
jgi:general secretion pathway protein K